MRTSEASKERKRERDRQRAREPSVRERKNELRSQAHKERRRIFSGIDGEGFSVRPGQIQPYVLLAASGTEALYNRERLRTNEILDYLLSLKGRTGSTHYVGFSLGYDINHWIRDLPTSRLAILKDGDSNRTIVWSYRFNLLYTITWVNKKFITISRKIKESGTWKIAASITIYDIHGFLQTSFLQAIKEWDVSTPEELEYIDRYKQVRGTDVFVESDIEGITKYNDLECKLIVKIIDKIDRTALDCGINLTTYCGAGSIASAIFKKEGVKEHLVRHEDKDEYLNTAVLTAYFGGRIQAPRIGYFPKLYSYDINSAYPAAMLNLPSLQGEWVREVSYRLGQTALYRVAFDTSNMDTVGILPTRSDKGRKILWTRKGEGWYWNYEIDVLMKLCPECITILDVLRFYPSTDTKPFAYVQDYYNLRKEYKKAKDPRHMVLKLGLNSGYGKLAQRKGFRDQRPPYQAMVWAGMITSYTRSKLLEIAFRNTDNVALIATDGIYLTKPDDRVEISDTLGGYETSEYEEVLIIQPGMYHSFGKTKLSKTRGYHQTELDDEGWELARQAMLKDGYHMDIVRETERFIGLADSGSKADSKRQWLTWSASPRRARAAIPGYRATREPSDDQYPVYRVDCIIDNVVSVPYRKGASNEP